MALRFRRRPENPAQAARRGEPRRLRLRGHGAGDCRRGRAARVREEDPRAGAGARRRGRPRARERVPAHGPGDAQESRADRDAARRARAHAVLRSRRLRDGDGQPPAAPLAAPPSQGPGRGRRAARGGGGARRRAHRGPQAPAPLRRCRAHHRPRRAEERAAARPLVAARQPRAPARACARDSEGRHAPREDARRPRGAGRLPRPSPPRRDGGTVLDGARRRRDRRRLPQGARRAACAADRLRDVSRRARAAGACAHRHPQPAGRLQQRPRLLHRDHQRPRRQGSRRLPPSPDAQERRALHHAGAEDLRGQGAVGARPRPRAGESALRRAAGLLAAHVPVLQRIARALAQVDVLACFAATAETRGYCRPEFTPDIAVEIDAGRHPVVESQVEPFIANGVKLSPSRQLLLVTGPNMGGKSTYMRQVALIVLMAHVGSSVPAKGARIGPIDQVFTRVGAADDLAGGRSTFMVEMTESANILHNATEKSLVLMDEVGRGTSTFDGLALAWAIARQLLEKNKALTLFATHYFEMTRLALEYKQAVNVHLDAVEHKDTIVFLHAVEEGPASQSYGLQVAQLAGVPKAVVRNARRYLQMLEEASLTHGGQSDLFVSGKPEPDTPPESDALRDALAAVSPDELSPREALELVYKLKRL